MADQEKTPGDPPERFFVKPGQDPKQLEDAIIQWVNEVRAKKGLAPLQEGEEPNPDELPTIENG